MPSHTVCMRTFVIRLEVLVRHAAQGRRAAARVNVQGVDVCGGACDSPLGYVAGGCALVAGDAGA